MIEHCVIAPTARIYHRGLVNLYNCAIGAGSTVGPFVEIQAGVTVGQQSKICSHSFLCAGVHIGSHVFVGHGVMFTNDLYPCIDGPFAPYGTDVDDWVSIGSGATLLPVFVRRGAIVGAGAVVVEDVPAYAIVVGNPARVVRQFACLEERNAYIRERAACRR